MAVKFTKQPRPHTREAYEKVVGSVTEPESKSTVVNTDGTSEPGPDVSPLTSAFKKASTPKVVDRGLDTDERLDGEEDGPDFDRESLKKPQPKKEEPKHEEEEEVEVEKKADVLDKKKATEALTDEEIDGIDETTLTDKHGRAPSREAWTTVKLMKEKISTMRTQHQAEIEELKKKAAPVEESDVFKALKKERDEIKSKMDEKYFEESPDFVNTFVQPFKDKEAEVAEWMSAADVEQGTPDHLAAVSAAGDLQRAMEKGDRKGFFIAAAKIQEYLPPGIDQQFLISVTEMYPLFQKKQEAFKDKDKARKTVTENDLSVVDHATKTIEKTMDDIFGSYEVENADLLKFYRSENVKDLIQYDETITSGKKEVRDLVREFVATRKPTEKLVRVLTDAVLKKFKDKEVDALRATLKDRSTMIENLQKELGLKKATLKKFSASGKALPSNSQSDDEDEPVSATPLTDRLKKMHAVR